MRKALAWPEPSLASPLRGSRCGGQPGAPGADPAQLLGEARPGPGLDLDVAAGSLSTGRLEVLEPGIGLFDQEDLVRLAAADRGPQPLTPFARHEGKVE